MRAGCGVTAFEAAGEVLGLELGQWLGGEGDQREKGC